MVYDLFTSTQYHMENRHNTIHRVKKISKHIAACLLLAACLFAGQSFRDSKNERTIGLFYGGCDSVPEFNRKIVDIVETKLNRKIGQGDAWDLIADVLNQVNAKWDHDYKFGRRINLKKECVYEGDIIEFTNIKWDYTLDNIYYREEMPLHTAIIYEVLAPDNFIIAEQNNGRLGQKVGLTPFKFRNIKAGHFKIFRPVKL